ncbi:uncharacterized protein BP5553_05057 [Venustampulla echinocandica]|uniref:AA1-like domain-containing protein n=1 Tax=Venustampulla echinocandica TaxID=2656787 RepID=A0A370TQ22_9HELO|nr:uncharacterized protein BP5553_05057 [Venustampulla echinocandica]RDL37624.1 hypothetical protein BP5553_05057 [Venustampulla echinocandica]
MKLPLLSLGLFAACSLAQNEDFNGYKPITLIFHHAAYQYQLHMYADGQSYNTNNDSVINIIESPDFDAYNYCNFVAEDKPALADQGNGFIGVGLPEPIISVSCRPTPKPPSTCLPVYGTQILFFQPWWPHASGAVAVPEVALPSIAAVGTVLRRSVGLLS